MGHIDPTRMAFVGVTVGVGVGFRVRATDRVRARDRVRATATPPCTNHTTTKTSVAKLQVRDSQYLPCA